MPASKLFLIGTFLAVAGLLSLMIPTGHVFGSFRHPAAYQIEFQDAKGKPIQGVQLEVLTKSGQKAFNMPVGDFTTDNIPMSDEKGVLKFHGSGMKFGGVTRHLFFVVPVTKFKAPVFECRFLYKGKVIHTVTYNELNQQLERKDADKNWTLHKMIEVKEN